MTWIPLLFAAFLVAGSPDESAAPAARACHGAAASADGVAVWGGASACGVGVLSDARVWIWNGAGRRDRPDPPIPTREDALLLGTGAGFELTLSAPAWRKPRRTACGGGSRESSRRAAGPVPR